MSSKKGRYEIFKGADEKWYFNRIAGNSEVEHPSQGYSTRGNAIAAIGRCMEDTSHYLITDREEPTLTFSGQGQSIQQPNAQAWDGEKA